MELLKPIPKRVSWFTCSQDGIGDSGMVSGIVNTLTQVIIANRYRDLVSSYLERNTTWRGNEPGEATIPRLYGLPVEFSPNAPDEPCWDVINFDLEKEPGVPKRYPYFRLFD